MPYAPWNAGGYYPFTYGRTTQTPQNMPGGSGGPPATTLPGYNVNPQPTSGQGPYGQVPGPIAVPPSTWQQATGAVPALGNTTQLTNNIMSELHGDINPQALKNMQDAAAAYGIQSGMPGSNAIPGTLLFNKNLRNIGLDTLAVQRQGQQDYTGLLNAVGGQQTPQALAAEIAAHNAQLKAAPDPTAAALQQLNDYLRGLNLGQRRATPSGGGGGGSYNPGGGTGVYTQLPFSGGTPGPAPYRPFSPAAPGSYNSPDLLYPGTEISGQPNLSSLLGPVNQNYSPYQSPFNPSLFGLDTPPNNSSFDGGINYDLGGGVNYGVNYDQTSNPVFDPNMTDDDYFYYQ